VLGPRPTAWSGGSRGSASIPGGWR
jgi:hypothetical protein